MYLQSTLRHVEANSRHTYDVTVWLSRTTDNSNIFIRSREVLDNESRLYICFQPEIEMNWNLMHFLPEGGACQTNFNVSRQNNPQGLTC